MQLRDKVVVITGAAGGIGEGCARRFADEGAKVVVTDINSAGVDRVSHHIGSVGIAVDITTAENVRTVAELARDTYGDIDIWFSNAGYAGPRKSLTLPDEKTWDLSWQLHVMSHVHAAREVLPRMLERGDGYLLQTASVVAMALQPDKSAYTVTKHAALALSEWLAASYRPKGIKVSCFCPGPMLTPMLAMSGYPPDHPVMKSALTPDQVADLLVKGIDEERFVILDSTLGTDSLAAKSADYERWITDMAQIVQNS